MMMDVRIVQCCNLKRQTVMLIAVTSVLLAIQLMSLQYQSSYTAWVAGTSSTSSSSSSTVAFVVSNQERLRGGGGAGGGGELTPSSSSFNKNNNISFISLERATASPPDEVEVTANSVSTPEESEAAAAAVVSTTNTDSSSQTSTASAEASSTTSTTVTTTTTSGESVQNVTATATVHVAPNTSFPPLDWSRVQDMDRPEVPLQRYEGVVVVTKILGSFYVPQLHQMLCLFTAAYNRHVNYDIIIFTTIPLEDWEIQDLQAVVPNTNLIVELEGPPLLDRVAQFTPAETERLYQRCQFDDGETNLTWRSLCRENPESPAFTVRLSYAWQAEFRAYHVWKHPLLAKYKYMIWVDSDAFATKNWDMDPMKVFIENDLVIMFDTQAGDTSSNRMLQDKMIKAYNQSYCGIFLENGHLQQQKCSSDDNNNNQFYIPIIQGFFHITNLDFYRSERSQRFLETLVETQKFSREWDDQIAITVPAVMDAPDKAWDMRANGLNMSMFHNGYLDGHSHEQVPVKNGDYRIFWKDTLQHEWDVGRIMCNNLITRSGR